MTKRQGEQSENQRVYSPSDIYILLTEKDATPEELIDLVFERNSPFIPLRILHPEGRRKKKIGDILKVLGRLREKQTDILNENGAGHLADQVEHSDVLLDAASIASKIVGDKGRRLPIYRKLTEEELKMSAEVLACLGFLSDNMRTVPDDGKFRLVSDDIPEQILSGNVDIASLPLGEVQSYVEKLHLNEWMKSTNAEIQECVAEAFQYLKELSAKLAPKGPHGQPYEMMADLGTQSFVNLIGIVLNKKLSLPRRFEAIRLLEWALAFFSIKRNPIFQAQQRVRKEIHDLFRMGVWDAETGKGEFGQMHVSDEIHRCAMETEKQNGEKNPPLDGHLELTGRYVKSTIRSMLGEKKDIVDTTNAVVFDSRDKTLESSALKLRLKAELVRRCEAIVGGETTMEEINDNERIRTCVAVKNSPTSTEKEILDAGKTLVNILEIEIKDSNVDIWRIIADALGIKIKDNEVDAGKIFAYFKQKNKTKAEKKLSDLKSRRRERGLDDSTFSVKPVMLDALDDHVGCAIVINLTKPLETLSRRERTRVASLFTSFALDLTNRLCLTNVGLPEGYLFEANSTNGKSSRDFRVYKIHANYPIEAEIFDGGKRAKKKIMVPVEIQFLPVESYLRAHMDGETGVHAYAERKVQELAPVLLPDHIDGQKVFPIATSAK